MTTDKSKTADLIARLEAAEHGSRELDRQIHFCVRNGLPTFSPGELLRCPPYTTSLDAITALITDKLPGWSGTADIVRSDRADGKFSAEVRPLAAEIGEDVEGSGNTSVLAVCIAFLRAIEGTRHAT